MRAATARVNSGHGLASTFGTQRPRTVLVFVERDVGGRVTSDRVDHVSFVPARVRCQHDLRTRCRVQMPGLSRSKHRSHRCAVHTQSMQRSAVQCGAHPISLPTIADATSMSITASWSPASCLSARQSRVQQHDARAGCGPGQSFTHVSAPAAEYRWVERGPTLPNCHRSGTKCTMLTHRPFSRRVAHIISSRSASPLP